MSSAELNAVFNIGDSVVYPLQGVGCILSREKRNSREYYRVQIASSDMDVLLPVDKAAEIGLRHLASVTEAKKALQKGVREDGLEAEAPCQSGTDEGRDHVLRSQCRQLPLQAI